MAWPTALGKGIPRRGALETLERRTHVGGEQQNGAAGVREAGTDCGSTVLWG